MKQITINEEARKKILTGTQKLSDLVGLTLGPRGRNVILEREHQPPLITNDGVTIARDVILPDKLENLGAQVLLQASNETNNAAGDGTTSAIVLAAELMRLGNRQIELGASPMLLKESLLVASKVAQKAVKEISKPMNSTDIYAIASNSCASEKDGKLIAKAFGLVEKDGTVTIQENRNGKTTLDHVKGCEINAQLASPYMIENPTNAETVYNDVHILLTDTPISNVRDILSILELTATQKLNLAILAPDFSQEVTNAILLNRVKAGIKVITLKLDEMGDRQNAILGDIAALTTATLTSSDAEITKEHLGKASQICATMTTTKLIADQSLCNTNLQTRLDLIQAQIATSQDDYTKTRLTERKAKLTSGIAIINVGAATEIELKEKKLRIEDAVSAVRAAADQGIVPGGGLAYLHAKKAINNAVTEVDTLAQKIMTAALEAITRRICKNADENPDTVLENIASKNKISLNIGFDARTKTYCNLLQQNIIDPTKVVLSVIKNATSAAATLLTTDAIIATISNNEVIQR